MASLNDLRFSDVNFLPIISDTNFTLVDASITEGVLTIEPGGYAECIPESTIVNLCFQYYKLEIDFESLAVSSINRFKNSPYIEITETYKDGNNAIDQNISRNIGFNNYNEIDASLHKYKQLNYCKSVNKNIAYYKLRLVNNSDEDLVISSLAAYSSIDISDDQVGSVVNSINQSTDPGDFKIYYTDSSYSLLSGLGVLLRNTDYELKYKPIYANGLLARIETNFGVTNNCVNIPEPIDISG